MKAECVAAVSIWLRGVRDKLGLSRVALATAAGVAPSTLRNAETSRHKITRRTAARLMQEISKRDAFLAQTAPSPLGENAPAPSPVAHLRFQRSGPRMLIQVEVDKPAVHHVVKALGDLLARSDRSASIDLPGLHFVLVEKT